MECSDMAERGANLEEIKEKFSQRSSKVIGMIKNVEDVYSKFIHVGFFSMQQLTLSLINESLNLRKLLTNKFLTLISL